MVRKPLNILHGGIGGTGGTGDRKDADYCMENILTRVDVALARASHH